MAPDSFAVYVAKGNSNPVFTRTVTTRALGSLIDDPSDTTSLVITSIGNSSSHFSSVDSAFGHSLQNSTTVHSNIFL